MNLSRWMPSEKRLSERIIITKAQLKEQQEYLIAASFDEKRMTQIQIEAVSNTSILGNICIGRVENIAENIQAAFITIAKGVSCFLPLEEVKNAVFTKKNGKKPLCIGDELLVEVTRESQKNKPPSVSTNLSFPGKYLILTTGNHLLGISKKLHTKERERMQQLLAKKVSDEFGIVVRTSAKDASDDEILKEFETLVCRCHACMYGAMHKTAFTVLRKAPPFYLHFLQNYNLLNVEKITTDLPAVYELLCDTYKDTPDAEKLCFYEDALVSLSALYSLKHELSRTLNRQVWLPSGAYLVIDPTEALTVIDVNSGKNIKKKEREELIFSVNAEAAREIARQLILRNISGICIIDFIDMKSKEHREELLHILRMELKKDKVPATLVDITRLGLVELTRKKVQKSLKEQLQGDVPDEK